MKKKKRPLKWVLLNPHKYLRCFHQSLWWERVCLYVRGQVTFALVLGGVGDFISSFFKIIFRKRSKILWTLYGNTAQSTCKAAQFYIDPLELGKGIKQEPPHTFCKERLDMCLFVAYGVFFSPLTQFLLMGTKKRNTICSRRELSSQPGLLTSAWWSGISVGSKLQNRTVDWSGRINNISMEVKGRSLKTPGFSIRIFGETTL